MAVLHFTDGLTIDHERCPRFIMARRHWRPGPDGAICACTPEPVAPDDWSRAFAGGGAA